MKIFLKKISLPFSIIIENGALLTALTKQTWQSRGKSGLIPLLWPFITPVFLLAVYYLAFGVILNLRRSAGQSNYALSLFCGITVFNIFAECLNSGSTSVISQSRFVKNAAFPLEVLPLTTVCLSLITGGIYIMVILAGTWISGIYGLGQLMFIIHLVPFLFFCSGIALFASALSVFFRDFPIGAALIQQGLFFLSPIIYSISIIPERCRFFVELNPLCGYIEAIRSSLLGSSFTGNWWLLWINGLVVYFLGFAFFNKTKKWFADVI